LLPLSASTRATELLGEAFGPTALDPRTERRGFPSGQLGGRKQLPRTFDDGAHQRQERPENPTALQACRLCASRDMLSVMYITDSVNFAYVYVLGR
jgi:hypothetical protein